MSTDLQTDANPNLSTIGKLTKADGRRSGQTTASLFASLFTLVLTIAPSPLRASDWEYAITPYIWGAGLSGDVGVLPGVPPAEVDLSFGDIFDDLEFAGMVVFSANNGRFGFGGDIQFIETQSDGVTPGPLYDATRVKSENTIITFTGDYVVDRTESSQVTAYAGVRYWSVESELSLTGGTAPDTTVRGSDEWFDALAGLRGRVDLSDQLYLAGWAALGGGGSDLMTDFFGGVGYKFTPTTSGVVGWRYLSVDRSDGDFVYDISQSGPILGLRFSF